MNLNERYLQTPMARPHLPGFEAREASKASTTSMILAARIGVHVVLA